MNNLQAVATNAADIGLMRCHDCGKLVRMQSPKGVPASSCPRCGGSIHLRIPDSINRTWAYLIASVILYIPANMLPIMTVKKLGTGDPHTIAGGIIALLHSGMFPIAALVFIASILVPLLKMISILILLVSVQRDWQMKPRQRTLLYRVVELVGRWSMLDIFVIALLVALVSLGTVAEIQAGGGAIAFGAVVVLTMFAANSFDSRLIWDRLGSYS